MGCTSSSKRLWDKSQGGKKEEIAKGSETTPKKGGWPWPQPGLESPAKAIAVRFATLGCSRVSVWRCCLEALVRLSRTTKEPVAGLTSMSSALRHNTSWVRKKKAEPNRRHKPNKCHRFSFQHSPTRAWSTFQGIGTARMCPVCIPVLG